MLAGFVEGDEIDVKISKVFWIDLSNSIDGHFTSFGWGCSLTHHLDDKKGTAVSHYIFAKTGCARSANLIVNVKSAANDGRVTNSTGEFIAPAAR